MTEAGCSIEESVAGILIMMTYEKWIEEVSKTNIVRIEETEHFRSRIFDKFGEEYDEEDPKCPPLAKN